jgi:hypothetical protein
MIAASPGLIRGFARRNPAAILRSPDGGSSVSAMCNTIASA